MLLRLEVLLRRAVGLRGQEVLLLLEEADHLRTPEQRLQDTQVEIRQRFNQNTKYQDEGVKRVHNRRALPVSSG